MSNNIASKIMDHFGIEEDQIKESLGIENGEISGAAYEEFEAMIGSDNMEKLDANGDGVINRDDIAIIVNNFVNSIAGAEHAKKFDVSGDGILNNRP